MTSNPTAQASGIAKVSTGMYWDNVLSRKYLTEVCLFGTDMSMTILEIRMQYEGAHGATRLCHSEPPVHIASCSSLTKRAHPHEVRHTRCEMAANGDLRRSSTDFRTMLVANKYRTEQPQHDGALRRNSRAAHCEGDSRAAHCEGNSRTVHCEVDSRTHIAGGNSTNNSTKSVYPSTPISSAQLWHAPTSCSHHELRQFLHAHQLH
ncbi:hypothetical protein C8Q74DRAFT_948782 [Fomes fomentarius]|nr:hypothetical protein C8Q74DRAFT_948782 [Fomes fomentarius]